MPNQSATRSYDKAASRKGPRTRAAILDAAQREFMVGGYEATTLEEIAATLGVTRGTVLFHFASKRALLLAIVEPLFLELEAIVRSFEPFAVPLAPRRRRDLLNRYCELLVRRRAATVLLVRDLTTIVQMNWATTGPEISIGFLRLLQGDQPDRRRMLATAAAVGAIIRPVVQPPFDPQTFDASTRDIVVNHALAAYRG